MLAVNWNTRKYTPEQFTEAWTQARSVYHVGELLGVRATGSGHESLKAAAKELGLTRDHMLGQAYARGQSFPARRKSLEGLLVEGRVVQGVHLRKRLVHEGLLVEKCYLCGLKEWLGHPAPLELDHINGRHDDNRIENLRLLCRNCHGLQPTHAGKNQNGGVRVRRCACPDCGGSKHPTSARCAPCAHKVRAASRKQVQSPKPRATKIEWPSDEELVSMLRASNYLQVGKALGVSDNAIRHRLKRRGVVV